MVGPEQPLAETRPLSDIAVTIQSGDITRTGRGEAVLGDPLRAVAWLSTALDESLEAGTVISTGSLTQTLPLVPGTRVTASFSRLGEVSVPIE